MNQMKKRQTSPLIDFCYQILGTEIKCDTSYQDNHCPKNLSSSNYELKKRGFLVDYFVRPPVSLTFVFENPIWVSNICLETQVGQQKTKGIQLFVNGDLDNCIARSFSNNPENKEIKFQNFAFPGNKIDFDKDQNKVRLGQPKSLENVKSLTLKIVATFQSSVICLANVQIWGKLNWSVDHKLKKEVESIWNALIKAKSIQNQDQVKPENYKKDEKTSSLKRSLAAADPDSIPEEFLDSLTCKRMDVPMLLPCGQYVDRSSLDNYNQIEAKWGRKPNDPFTGLGFSETKKAIFDDKLKARIDSFVLGAEARQIATSKPSSSTHQDEPLQKKIATDTVDNEKLDEKSGFEYSGKNIDALLNQALAGRERILGQSAHRSRSIADCKNCGGQNDLYMAKCCNTEWTTCKSCLLQWDCNIVSKAEEKWKCQKCNKPWTKRDFAKFHSAYKQQVHCR